MAQQDVQAIEWMRRMLAVDKWPIPKLYLAALLALNGKEAEARETVKNYIAQRHRNQEHSGARNVAIFVVRHSPMDNLRQSVIGRSAKGWYAGGVSAFQDANSSSRTFASFRSSVSKPSVNQP